MIKIYRNVKVYIAKIVLKPFYISVPYKFIDMNEWWTSLPLFIFSLWHFLNFRGTKIFKKITKRIQNFPRTCIPCLTLLVLNTSSTPWRPFLWKANLIWTKDKPLNAILWALPLEIDLEPTRGTLNWFPFLNIQFF